jgi:hypothetical protein
MWNLIARILARPAIADRLIAYAMKTPYLHLPSNQDPSYMARYWVFNPYDRVTNKPRFRWCPWSIRVHHIKRADSERHMHDHPWNARTIILKGGYVEERENLEFESMLPTTLSNFPTVTTMRFPASTAKLGFEQYHRITHVPAGGAWTLFISGPWQGVWGFLVDGVKVEWRKYLGIEPK